MFDNQIEIDRINRRLDALFQIGRTDKGGVQRHAYTPEEQEAHDYIKNELSDEYTIEVDSVGNLYATREPDAEQHLYVGSHLDNNPNGGRLDGTLGVVTALEAIDAVYGSGYQPEVPPKLVAWRAEEPRFGVHTPGSRMALGRLSKQDLSSTDKMGYEDVTLEEAIEQAGFEPPEPGTELIDVNSVYGYLESHIEQGRVLDDEDENVGIVTSIRAPVRFLITVLGEEDHSGATPMDYRQDAIAGAAEMVTAIEEQAKQAAREGDIVATVGSFEPLNGVINKVNGEVTFTIDIRSKDSDFRDKFEETVFDHLHTIADRRTLEIETELLDRTDPVILDEQMVQLLERGAKNLDTSYRRMPSGAGHDAMNLQKAGIPTGMLFVPSVNGISHNPNEETYDDAVEDMTKVFAYGIQNVESFME